MWTKNKFYGQKITIAFRVADGGLPASCITGGITDGAMAMAEITQRRWSRGWRRRWWRESRRWRSATPRSSRPRRTASRDPSTSRTDGREGTSSAGSTPSPFSEVGAAFELWGELENLEETSHVVSPARQAPPGSCSRRNATSFATPSFAAPNWGFTF